MYALYILAAKSDRALHENKNLHESIAVTDFAGGSFCCAVVPCCLLRFLCVVRHFILQMTEVVFRSRAVRYWSTRNSLCATFRQTFKHNILVCCIRVEMLRIYAYGRRPPNMCATELDGEIRFLVGSRRHLLKTAMSKVCACGPLEPCCWGGVPHPWGCSRTVK